MTERSFNLSWVGVYRASSNSYHSSGDPIRAGGGYQYNSYIGFPSSVKDAIASSKTSVTMKLRIYVTNGGEFDVGGHRESYNKAYGTMPWYRYLGLHPIFGTGWHEIDLTNAFMGEYLDGDYSGIVLYGGSDYAEAVGKDGSPNRAQIVLEGDWNTPPSKPPSFTSPRASTVASQNVTVSWEAGSDAEDSQSELSYRLGYYDGSSWVDYWEVGAGQTSYEYPVFDKPETSSAQFVIRAIDSQGGESGWTYSPFFTVDHNQPPEKPTNLNPSGGKKIDRSKLQRFSWHYNDDGTQAGYRIAWRPVNEDGTFGEYSYVPSPTGFVNSTSHYHDFAPDTFPVSEIEWTMRVIDQQGSESEPSDKERFFAGVPSDAPIWVNPTSGGTVNSSNIVVNWSSINQIEYEVELLNSGQVLWSTSGTNSAKSVEVGYALENNTSYQLRVRVLEENSGIWSDWSEVTFSTQFIPPAKPLITIDTIDNNGESLSNPIVIWDTDNPATETITTHVQVLRRKYDEQVEQPWLSVRDTLPPDSSTIDYSPASDQWYEYKVRAWSSTNDTYTDSDVTEVKLELNRTFIQREQSLSDMLVVDASERDSGFNLQGQLMHFAGRKKPVFEHSLQDEHNLNISWFIETAQELRNTLVFVKRPETFLYRDNNGRRFFCVLRNPQITDRTAGGFDFSIELIEVDYKENFLGG